MATPHRGLKPDHGKDARAPRARARRRNIRFEAVGVTDIGRQRKHNEDHVLLRPELDLFVVADGMGGHNAGDVASKLATVSLRNFYEATVDGDLPEGPLSEGYTELPYEARRLAAGIRKANRDVFEISSTYRQHHGMGSTVVAAHIARERGVMHVGHVGDSRCYRYREGDLVQLTHDHSLINDALALKPDLTPEELARLPKNIITRALGMREDVKVDIRTDDMTVGDIYLLCSDGLSGMVTEEEIGRVLGAAYAIEGSDLREACETLVSLANEAGGNDNITALLIRIEEMDEVGEGDDEDDDADVAGSGPEVEAGAMRRMNTDEIEAVATEQRARPTLVRCPRCAASVEPDNAFCTECGASIETRAHP
ncbi:MAG: SpoIIE family protein phosphatase [Polyangiaceae bacterium]|nr:SpoIIE family protein phosphatase [Polyangiaceae bacterium]